MKVLRKICHGLLERARIRRIKRMPVKDALLRLTHESSGLDIANQWDMITCRFPGDPTALKWRVTLTPMGYVINPDAPPRAPGLAVVNTPEYLQ